MRCPACSQRGYDSFSDICGAWFGFGSGFGIGFTLTLLLPFFSPPSFHTLSLSPRSLVCGGQPSPRKPRLVVSHSTCPPLSSSPHAHSFVLGTAEINNYTERSGLPNNKMRYTHVSVVDCVSLFNWQSVKLDRCCSGYQTAKWR